MLDRRNAVLGFVLGGSLWGSTVMASAVAQVAVPNGSFESPTVSPVGFGVSLTIDDWTTTGPANEVVDIGSGPQNSGVGIFPNPSSGAGSINNADQNQLAYMFSNSTHTLSQVLDTDFQADEQYILTVGVANAGAIPSAGDTLTIQLFYTTTDDPPTQVIVATRNVVEGTDTLSQSELTDFSASTSGPLDETFPEAAGRPIGILFTTTGVGGGEFDLDNVRIPEPGTIGIAGIAGMLSVFVRRRSTR